MKIPYKTLRLFLSTLLFAAPLLYAQTVVTTTADEDDGDASPGNGTGTSLREAVKYAAADATVTFTNTLSGETVSLTNGQIRFTQSVSIDASALSGGITIDGSSSNRLFQCNNGTTNTMTGLTLTGGYTSLSGAAFLNNGHLTINECTLSGNTADQLGGAIRNNNVLILNNSTISDNSGSSGGGIYSEDATLTINNSTLSGNSSVAGGGIYLLNGTAAIINSTISTNTSSSGGGLFNYAGSVTLENSIVAGNTYNINNISTTPTLQGINIVSGDPMLAPLGDYGGPTPTMPPLSGSPAIDPAGGTNSSVFATDQRGMMRVAGGIVDVGAVEVNHVVSATEDSVPGSLRYIYEYAIPGATITFTNSLSGQTLFLTNGQIRITRNTAIDASALPDGIILDGNGENRLFQCNSGTTNSFTALMFTGGYTSVSGAAFLNNGHLTINNCTLFGNIAGQYGGAVRNNNVLILNNSTITGNSAGYDGGGLSSDAKMTLNNSTLADNSAGVAGGINNYGQLNMNNCIVAVNAADYSPNVYNQGSVITSGINITSGDPMLAPLGAYGGPTLTMLPLPGSPAIDPGGGTNSSSFATDQRGFARVSGGILDSGAAEYRDDDLYAFWPIDMDGDGNTFGNEYALGTDWTTPDAANSANLSGGVTNGNFVSRFGFNTNAPDNLIIWTLQRSTDLVNEPFETIFSYSSGFTTTYVPMDVTTGPDSFSLTDLSDPQPTNAFYRFHAIITN